MQPRLAWQSANGQSIGARSDAKIARNVQTPRQKNQTHPFRVDGVLTDGKICDFPRPLGAQQSVLEQGKPAPGRGRVRFQRDTSLTKQGFPRP